MENEFMDELFSNNSIYMTISKEMDEVEYLYYKYKTDSVGKFNKIQYNKYIYKYGYRYNIIRIFSIREDRNKQECKFRNKK